APLEEIDPIRALACLEASQWLAAHDHLPPCVISAHPALQQAARAQIVEWVVGDVPGPVRDELTAAPAGAWGAPRPDTDGSLASSVWLPVYRSLANAAGVEWPPGWTAADLRRANDHFPLFPDRFRSFLRHHYERLKHCASQTGWDPCFLDLAV